MWFGDPNPLERKSKVQLTANEPLDPSQKPRTQLALSPFLSSPLQRFKQFLVDVLVCERLLLAVSS